jgi:hypothetical protein
MTRKRKPGMVIERVGCPVEGCEKTMPLTREAVLNHLRQQHVSLSDRERALLADKAMGREDYE